MKTRVGFEPLPQGTPENEPFTMTLPDGAQIIRAAIEPKKGIPVIWVSVTVPDDTPAVGGKQRRFVAVRDGATIEGDCTHVGMWWEGNVTFHLFELMG
jgi:hypothetical protein